MSSYEMSWKIFLWTLSRTHSSFSPLLASMSATKLNFGSHNPSTIFLVRHLCSSKLTDGPHCPVKLFKTQNLHKLLPVGLIQDDSLFCTPGLRPSSLVNIVGPFALSSFGKHLSTPQGWWHHTPTSMHAKVLSRNIRTAYQILCLPPSGQNWEEQ